MHPLDQRPRVEILTEATPLTPLPRLTRALGDPGPRLWIKRDDLSPLALGGNKLRKLEYLLGDALEVGADTVITIGAAQSNHAAQTAAAAARHGLQAVLLLKGRPGPPRGNLILDDIFSAEVRLRPDPPADWGEQVAAELLAAGRRPYLIPYGGTSVVGVLGYMRAGRELQRQVDALGLDVAAVVHASSSGGTQSGLTLALADALLRVPVIGMSVQDPADTLSRHLMTLGAQAAARWGVAAPREEHVQVDDRALGDGYAHVTEAAKEAARLLARTEGLLVDGVYTAKALAGLIELVKAGRFPAGSDVVFIHTGGMAGLFA